MTDDLSSLTLAELLAEQRDLRARTRVLDDEIRRRGLTRTRGRAIWQLVELAVARAYGGALERTGTPSSDVVLADGRRIQVKTRELLQEGRFFPFETWGFDLAVVVFVDEATGELRWARELAEQDVRARATPHRGGGHRLTLARAKTAGREVTGLVREAFVAL